MMDSTTILTVASSLVAALFGVLSVIIGWMGSRVIVRLDSLVEKMSSVKEELHQRINTIDIRLVRVESKVEDE